MCGAGSGGDTRPGTIEGRVQAAGGPVEGAYVRLLDETGEFTAEVRSAPGGDFRFFARPGNWTVRALSPGRGGEATVRVEAGEPARVDVALS